MVIESSRFEVCNSKNTLLYLLLDAIVWFTLPDNQIIHIWGMFWS